MCEISWLLLHYLLLFDNLLLVLQGNAGVDSLAVAELDGRGREEEERFPPA